MGELVLLIDDTVSGPGEILAAMLKGTDRVTLVGQKTAGLCGEQTFIPMNGGGLNLTYGVCHVEDETLHVRGVRPDEAVFERSWRGQTNKDLLLEKAQEILQKT